MPTYCPKHMFDLMSSSSESTSSLTQEQLQKAKVAIDFLSSLSKTEGNIFYIIFAIFISILQIMTDQAHLVVHLETMLPVPVDVPMASIITMVMILLSVWIER